MEEFPPLIMETKEEEVCLKEEKYIIISENKNEFNIIIKKYLTYIEINVVEQKSLGNKFSEKYSLHQLKENKFLSICDSIGDIYDELNLLLSKNNTVIKENEKQIFVIIPTEHIKYKEINFTLKSKEKTDKEKIDNLYMIISNLQKENKEKDEKINKLYQELNNLKFEIDNISKKLKELTKINNQLDKHIKFEEIENPWSKEIDKVGNNKFWYILKEDDYYAEKNEESLSLYTIRAKHQFESNYIYKVTYSIYFDNDMRIGFGNFGKGNGRLKEKDSVGITSEGLFIDGTKVSKNIFLDKSNKEIIFIINLKEKVFELFIDGKYANKFNFNLDNIYGLAAFRRGSLRIKTFRAVNQ